MLEGEGILKNRNQAWILIRNGSAGTASRHPGKTILLTFSANICSTITISVNQMSFPSLIQSALNTLARKLVSCWFAGIVDGQIVTISSASFTCIRFFLFKVEQAVTLTKRFQLTSDRVKRNLDKVLIVATANIDFLLHAQIEPDNHALNFIGNAMVNNQPCPFVEIVPNLIVSIDKQSSLTRA